MKIKNTTVKYEDVINKEKPKRQKPKKPNILFRTLLKIVSFPDLIATGFSCKKIGMEKLGKNEPCLILMNHSSFIDLEIATSIFYPKPVNIVCTTDAFMGKNWLMRQLGCFPTKKFMSDLNLIKDMVYVIKTLKSSILMFPEAGYSFDGTTTVLPDSLGKCIKLLNIPVVMVTTHGAYLRQPLYNNLIKRKIKVSADVEYVLSPEEISSKSVNEINELVKKLFSFDAFREQQENNITVKEKNRAEGLNRILYKCPCCNGENTKGEGSILTCLNCGKEYELTENGFMKALNGETEIAHIPDWYLWERECVKKEIEEDNYFIDLPVDIMIMVDTYKVYNVGEGRLTHGKDGFTLTGCDGKINYKQGPAYSYTVNSDLYWYQIGDTVCIGDMNVQYYCFPKTNGDHVVKMRLAAEELFKMNRKK